MTKMFLIFCIFLFSKDTLIDKNIHPVFFATYWLRISSKPAEKKQIKIMSVMQDSLVVGLSGPSVIVTNSLIDLFSENGYTKIVGTIGVKDKVFYLKHRIVSRTISIVGEKLPSNVVITSMYFVGDKKIIIDKSVFVKIDSSKLSYSVKKMLLFKK